MLLPSLPQPSSLPPRECLNFLFFLDEIGAMNGFAAIAARDEKASGSECRKRSVTIMGSVASSDDIQEIAWDTHEACAVPRYPNRDDFTDEMGEAPRVAHLHVGDAAAWDRPGDAYTDWSPDSGMINVSPLRLQMNDTHAFHERISCHTIEEVSSVLSVEEKVPLNAEVAAARAMKLFLSSAQFLRAYQHLKSIVQQRTYRCYYIKWLESRMRQPKRSASTQTTLREKRCSPSMTSSLTEWEVPTAERDAPSTRPPSSSSEFPNEYYSGRDGFGGPTPHNQRDQPSAPTPTHPFMLVNGTHTSTSEPPSPSTLRSRSRPHLLQDYGQQSPSPQRGAAQDDDLPCTQLPHLTHFGRNVTVLDPQNNNVRPDVVWYR
ncbi:hypothetical protein DQ04_00661220 [Trypanosoma grayi]|uniref:hypothetical protein n=1 Tax=Trypanosoma grayi TaxID=71804 RepID=UPI0004F41DC8|nr:hypothetical protein DQ04_00661220 [Trypanosoma grayi]KEG14044.1 hypothetical protein DQ04_00661220 [Trypanosoma grayi]